MNTRNNKRENTTNLNSSRGRGRNPNHRSSSSLDQIPTTSRPLVAHSPIQTKPISNTNLQSICTSSETDLLGFSSESSQTVGSFLPNPIISQPNFEDSESIETPTTDIVTQDSESIETLTTEIVSQTNDVVIMTDQSKTSSDNLLLERIQEMITSSQTTFRTELNSIRDQLAHITVPPVNIEPTAATS